MMGVNPCAEVIVKWTKFRWKSRWAWHIVSAWTLIEYNWHLIICFIGCSENGSIISKFLTDMVKRIENCAKFDLPDVHPFLLLNGHGWHFEEQFLDFTYSPVHKWKVCISIPYGKPLCQVGDSKEQNGSFKCSGTEIKAVLVQKRPITKWGARLRRLCNPDIMDTLEWFLQQSCTKQKNKPQEGDGGLLNSTISPTISKSLNQLCHFLSQNTAAKGKEFNINSSLYVDGGMFLIATREETEQAAQLIHDHLAHFSLQMPFVSDVQKLKTEAMFFPTTLTQAKKQDALIIPSILVNEKKNRIHLSPSFKYLRAILTPKLTEDCEIGARINKASSQLGILRHFFKCQDIDRHMKYWVFYIAGPPQHPPMGYWVLESIRNKPLQASFLPLLYYQTDPRVQVGTNQGAAYNEWTCEKRIFKNIPTVDAFITWRVWRYIGKAYHKNEDTIPKKGAGSMDQSTKKRRTTPDVMQK